MSIIGYRHPLLHPPEARADLPIRVASDDDLVAMKLSAIGNRGAAKDFWDLDVMLRAGVCDGRLDVALACFREKYPNVDPGYVVRGLAYFGNADAEPFPAGLDAAEWSAIKSRFVARVLELVRP